MVTAKAKRKASVNSVKSVMAALGVLSAQLASADLLPFGAAFSDQEHNIVSDSLIAHRVVNKWHIPNKEIQERLQNECFSNWIEHEKKISSFTFDDSQTLFWDSANDKWVKHKNDLTANHYKAIANMRGWLRPINHMLREWDTYGDTSKSYMDLDFTPGESFVSASGFTSVRQKLMTSTWTVTPNLVDWALTVCLKHKAIYEAALTRLWPLALDHEWNNRVNSWLASGRIDYSTTFQLYVRKYLLTVVSGARAASVEKNVKTRRFINIEPLFNMLYQRGVGLILRRALAMVGNDLEEGQNAHNVAICTMLYSTVDLRNASDSNIYIAAKALLQRSSAELWKSIDRSRSETTTFFNFPVKGVESVEVNCKLSSMGNGFTFEVMTLLLLAQARVFDNHARVYGDDIIIRNDGPHGFNATIMFIDLISTTGWQINPDKTFHDSRFYESCGGFVHDGKKLVSFDIGPVRNNLDIIVVANKLYKIIDYCNGYNSTILQYLVQCRDAILLACPHLVRGPVRQDFVSPFNKSDEFHTSLATVNCDYIESPGYLSSNRRKPDVSKAFRDHIGLAKKLKDLGYVTSLPVVVGKVWRFRSKSLMLPRDSVQCVFTKNYYLYANRVGDDTIRGKGHWSSVTVFIFSDGYVLPIAAVRETLRRHFRANQVGPKPLCYYPSYVQGIIVNLRSPSEDGPVYRSDFDIHKFLSLIHI